MTDPALEQKLEALLKRKAELEQKLGLTRASEKGVTRNTDTKYRVSSGRAVQARAKKTEKAMLQTINQMIKRIRTQIAAQQNHKNKPSSRT